MHKNTSRLITYLSGWDHTLIDYNIFVRRIQLKNIRATRTGSEEYQKREIRGISAKINFLKLQVRHEDLNPYSPMMKFFYKTLLSEEIFSKMNIFGFFKKTAKKTKCLGSNKKVNVASFCVVVQSKPYLWHWKMYFTLILKFCLDYPIETKQENH